MIRLRLPIAREKLYILFVAEELFRRPVSGGFSILERFLHVLLLLWCYKRGIDLARNRWIAQENHTI